MGQTPKLLHLEEGDFKITIDFRQVYASELEDWLGLSNRRAQFLNCLRCSVLEAAYMPNRARSV